MRLIVLLICTLLLSGVSIGQSGDVWVRFMDTTTNLSGYKDLQGNIKIPAKFQLPTRADSFYHIIAVDERVDRSYKHYYLLKNGRQVARDSLFAVDFLADCESEGKILFHDRKNDRVGYLDKNGVAIIPALYNYATPFRNGVAVARRGATKSCLDGKEAQTDCEHWGWQGGETVLINDRNEVLADSISIDTYDLDWYSKRINDPAVDTSVFINIKGRNGTVYSFADLTKEFRKWFTTVFIPDLDKADFSKHLFSEITYWSDDSGWISRDSGEFLKTFPGAITKKRFLETELKKMSIYSDQFNELIFDKSLYKNYLGACGEHNHDRYPLLGVLLSYHKNRDTPLPPEAADDKDISAFYKAYEHDYQEHFEFLRTEGGYKLLSVSLKK